MTFGSLGELFGRRGSQSVYSASSILLTVPVDPRVYAFFDSFRIPTSGVSLRSSTLGPGFISSYTVYGYGERLVMHSALTTYLFASADDLCRSVP